MKKYIMIAFLSGVIGFIVAQNYILSHMEVRRYSNNQYMVTVFGNDFLYEE